MRIEDFGVDLEFMSWSDIIRRTVPPPEFQVEGLVPLRGVTLITGEGGIGKSFMLIAMAYAIATGTRFLGKFACGRGGAVVLDMENDDTTVIRRAQKVLAAQQGSASGCLSRPGCEDTSERPLPIHILSKRIFSRVPFLIDREGGYEALDRVAGHYSPALLVIDPLTAIHSTDENDNIAMRRIIMLLQHIARTHNLAVVVVHHPRKRGMINDAGQMIRGASDLRNAVDSHLFLRKLSSSQILVVHDKSRHAPAVERFKVEMVDTEDGAGTLFRYLGDANEVAVKQTEGGEAVLRILKETGSCRRGELVVRAKAEGIGRATLDRALSDLLQSGEVGRCSRGVYVLSQARLNV